MDLYGVVKEFLCGYSSQVCGGGEFDWVFGVGVWVWWEGVCFRWLDCRVFAPECLG